MHVLRDLHKKQNGIKGSPSNLKKYLRLINDFNPTISLQSYKKNKYHLFDNTSSSNDKIKNELFKLDRSKSLTTNKTNFQQNKQKKLESRYEYNPQKAHKSIEKYCSIDTSLKRHTKLPKFIQKTKNKQLFLFQTKSNSRVKTQPHQQNSSFYLKKLQGTSNGNILDYVKMKPTQKYFSRMKNVQIAEKLLLIKPSQQLTRSSHQKFWDEQQSYRRKISHSIMVMKQTQRQNKKCFRIRTKLQWLF